MGLWQPIVLHEKLSRSLFKSHAYPCKEDILIISSYSNIVTPVSNAQEYDGLLFYYLFAFVVN